MQNIVYSLLLSASVLISAQPDAAEQRNPQVMLETEMGHILLELYPASAPVTVNNFIRYVNEFHYDGLIFHRVIKGFMIQTGGFTFDFSPRSPTYDPIVNESNKDFKNKRGTVAMARTSDPDSATTQFFINHKNNRSLDTREEQAGYAVFGKVIAGMDVVDAIASVETQTVSLHADVPVKAIRILKARLIDPESWSLLPTPSAELPSYEKPVPIK